MDEACSDRYGESAPLLKERYDAGDGSIAANLISGG